MHAAKILGKVKRLNSVSRTWYVSDTNLIADCPNFSEVRKQQTHKTRCIRLL